MRKIHSVTGITGRHNTIEHIQTGSYRHQQILRGADPHQIAGVKLRHLRAELFDHVVHGRLTLTDT